ncbi:DUF3343 domain-containing protein [Clostridium tyrobutyricum]|uniref:DUF3343 domain-containing protein n=1 Tax=Clostridium tyrobutyricum TaxID=1519 RepID=UPI0018AC51AA|nr:DUF3343 domain-containing protein [Clostridium tyrobutyricum]MBV4450943.1 DUF3343 domain-containing protein [Clostridium tyrobutyricum]
MNRYYIITFKNTHDAIAGETFFRNKNISIDVMPTPVVITKSCGISIKFDVENLDKVKFLFQKEKISFKNIYLRNSGGYKLIGIKGR